MASDAKFYAFAANDRFSPREIKHVRHVVLCSDMEPIQTGAHVFAPVPPSGTTEAAWLTVPDAVTRCAERGLPRTPKTIRRWAARSYASVENADISVRREDIENGFRWSIEAGSLDRKIDEELTFERNKVGEPVQTGALVSEPVSPDEILEIGTEPSSDMSEPVQTRAHQQARSNAVEDELRAQLKQTQEEVLFLRDELKHRRKTDEALGRVIEAFRLTSEANSSRTLDVRRHDDRPSWADQPRHDIVHSDREPPAA